MGTLPSNTQPRGRWEKSALVNPSLPSSLKRWPSERAAARIRAAVEALTQLEAKSAYPILRGALTDPDPAVRQGALAALGELGDRRVLPDFQQRLLLDADPGVRTEAAYRLGKLGDAQELEVS